MPSDISCETTGHQDCVTRTQDNASQQSVAIAPNIRVRLGGVGVVGVGGFFVCSAVGDRRGQINLASSSFAFLLCGFLN